VVPGGVDKLAAVGGRLFAVGGGGRYAPVGAKLNIIDPSQCSP
jgi:hypothetical protein